MLLFSLIAHPCVVLSLSKETIIIQSSTECKTLGVAQNYSQSLSTHVQMCPVCVVGVVDRVIVTSRACHVKHHAS